MSVTGLPVLSSVPHGSGFQSEPPSLQRLPNSNAGISGLAGSSQPIANPSLQPALQVYPGIESFSSTKDIEGCRRPGIETIQTMIKDTEATIKLTPARQRTLRAKVQELQRGLPMVELGGISISMGGEALKKSARAKVFRTDGDPGGTINDPKMGVINRNEVCSTCYKTVSECAGHIGLLELGILMYHPTSINWVTAVLSSVCNSCAGLLLSKDEIESQGYLRYNGTTRLKMISKESDGKICRRADTEGCTSETCSITENECDKGKGPGQIGKIIAGPIRPCSKNPIYKTKKSIEKKDIYYRCDKKDKTDRKLPIKTVKAILDGISKEDSLLLGFAPDNHPKDLIMDYIIVIPPCARNPNIKDGVYSDNLGEHYRRIINKNNEFGKLEGIGNKSARDNIRRELIGLVTELIKSEDSARKSRIQNFKPYQEQIKGKEGLLRKYAMGKRVNFSARSVVGPEPNMRITQIGIPIAWASYLTVPVHVDNSNIKSLTSLMKQGKVKYVETPAGDRILVDQKNRDTYNLMEGDKISRWLQDGDWVVINRQPTLHAQGLMGHEVVLHDDLIVKLHPSVTTPYNADYDGDEMNAHAPQTEEAIEETEKVMGVKQCLMNPQSNKPLITMIQDALTGSYLLTQPDTLIDQDTWFDILTGLESIFPSRDITNVKSLENRLKKYHVPMFIIETTKDVDENGNVVEYREKKYTGRALYSAMLPDTFYFSNGEVIILDGVLVQGVISSKSISSYNSIVQQMIQDYGNERTVQFLTDVPFATNRFLDDYGFSVGLKDCYLPNRADRKIKREELARAQVLLESMSFRTNDPIESERMEKEIISVLDRAETIGTKIAGENIPDDNRLSIMAKGGGKGNKINITKLTTMGTQQFIRGERMPYGLSYFEKGDIANPEARGFVTSSFVEGLTPAEFWFGQMAGRENLADTAVKTASVGHIRRELVKASENIVVRRDGSVRDAQGHVIQFAYGHDGLEPKHLHKISYGGDYLTSFIDLKHIIGKINTKHGYPPTYDPTV